jgi:hypothetical protein
MQCTFHTLSSFPFKRAFPSREQTATMMVPMTLQVQGHLLIDTPASTFDIITFRALFFGFSTSAM